MASETTNYKLVKPDPEEFYDIGVQNSNLDKIDTALKELEDSKANNADLTSLQQTVTSHLADDVNHVKYADSTNSGNNYSVSLNPAPTSYINGMAVAFRVNANSTGETTLNVNGLGAKPILNANGDSVANLIENGIYTVRYNPNANGGNGAFILQGESEVKIGQQIIVPSIVNQPILKGIHDGTGYVEGSPNLVPENIKKGVNIFGVVGNIQDIRTGTRTMYYENFTVNVQTGIDFSVFVMSVMSSGNFFCFYNNGSTGGNNMSFRGKSGTIAQVSLDLRSGDGRSYRWFAF